MFTNMTNNDLRVGDILTVRNGNKYAVVADDNGHHDVINLCGKPTSNGIEVGTDKLAVCGGNKKGGRDVVMVQRFDAMPARNRLSEALKTLTGHEYTEVLTTIWVEEDPKKKAARDKVEKARRALAEAEEAYATFA